MMLRLREVRKKKHYTMKQLGEMVGLSESTISLYETGKHEPDHATLVRIARILDTSVDYLLGVSDTPSANENQSTAQSRGLDEELIDLLSGLSPGEVQRVQDFVSGLKASRADESSPHK